MGIFDQLQDLVPWLLGVSGIIAALLWISWCYSIGAMRGTMAILCRVAWLAPLFLAFFPETLTQEEPRSMTLRPLHILVDDSSSMRQNFAGDIAADAVQNILEQVDSICRSNGCLPQITKLSSQDERVAKGFSPLSNIIEPWLYKVGSEQWMIISDGGDWRPESTWDSKLANAGRSKVIGAPPKAMIVGFAPSDKNNIILQNYNVPPFSFENKPLQIEITLSRASESLNPERVQVQIQTADKALATVNAEFVKGEKTSDVFITIPALARGRHLLEIHALPTASETTLWDNTAYAEVEVMPNTVGILHLLGSPSWDGRFVRRYLKAEPKYDLISFFILRDPWDSQQVNEREMSLIPFPVERLFQEELPNFRVVVIQNFTLFQFLQPEYQANLVKFVKEGGGLLFLGGPRALLNSDLESSPLKEILPFKTEGLALNRSSPLSMMRPGGNQPPDPNGPAYDPDTKFKVELANPESHKRSLANVYDDWEKLRTGLESWDNAQGLHHMERVEFKEGITTPLLNARTKDGGTVPLAVASYPGKGRALWLFSDSLWKFAMTAGEEAPRRSYNTFLQAAMTWLMRQNLKKPLIARNLQLDGEENQPLKWNVTLKGPATKYYRNNSEWVHTVCGQQIRSEDIQVEKSGSDELVLSGRAESRLAGGQKCKFAISGNHPAFGSVKAEVIGIYPRIYSDKEVGRSPLKLQELANLTGAQLTLPPSDPVNSIREWIEGSSENLGVALPSKFKTQRDFYWVLDTQWYWFLLLFIPIEVLIRRWDQFSAKKSV